MSDRKLTDWLDSYMEYTDNSEPPVLFRLWTAISVLAAALQRKCYVDWGMLTFYPNLYIILVGPSGTRKGTAMYPGQDLLRELGVSLAADATTLQALIRRLKETNSTQLSPETGLPVFHSSMTIFSKEFTVLYKNDELIASLCDWYDCDAKWKYDTKNSGTDEILGVWVNMIGATTPDMVRSSLPLDAIGGGLTSRIIFVAEQNKAKTVAMPFLSEEQLAIKHQLFADLEKISMLVGRFKCTKNFMEYWVEWYTRIDSSPPIFDSSKFSGYMQRRPNHAMKLSMIMSISRSSEMVLRQKDLERAIKLMEITERNMPTVFDGVGENPVASLVPRITAFMSIQKQVGYDVLMRYFYQDIDDFNMDKLLRSMENMGYLKLTYTGTSPTLITYLGIPTNKNYSKEM